MTCHYLDYCCFYFLTILFWSTLSFILALNLLSALKLLVVPLYLPCSLVTPALSWGLPSPYGRFFRKEEVIVLPDGSMSARGG
jgi:hypothetical protein